MPRIIPIWDLKKTSEISQMGKNADEPIFVTKNGYGDMVIISMKLYEDRLLLQDIYAKLDAAEADIETGRVTDARESLKHLRAKHGV